MVHRAQTRDVATVLAARVVAVEVEDVVVPAPHLVAETREPRDRERAVGELRHRNRVAQELELPTAGFEVRPDARDRLVEPSRRHRGVPGQDSRHAPRVKRRVVRLDASQAHLRVVRRGIPITRLGETKPLRRRRGAVERVRGVHAVRAVKVGQNLFYPLQKCHVAGLEQRHRQNPQRERLAVQQTVSYEHPSCGKPIGERLKFQARPVALATNHRVEHLLIGRQGREPAFVLVQVMCPSLRESLGVFSVLEEHDAGVEYPAPGVRGAFVSVRQRRKVIAGYHDVRGAHAHAVVNAPAVLPQEHGLLVGGLAALHLHRVPLPFLQRVLSRFSPNFP
mmetsp:Transcript_17/g.58  ORF Transcript_17/g.58 Transcript_17/m.58 type:complete len:336 (+) Transcript_17:718-1725(+)